MVYLVGFELALRAVRWNLVASTGCELGKWVTESVSRHVMVT